METKLQAPKGGCYSTENQEWYEGGQFLPSTCLPKGIAKKVKKAMKNKNNLAKLEAKKGMIGFYVNAVYTDKPSKTVMLESFDTTEDANLFIDVLIKEKEEEYKIQGLIPHPTNIIKL